MYHIEVYEPVDLKTGKRLPLFHSQSDQPFLSISVGDYVNQSHWIENGAPWTNRLRVTEIEHVITKSNGKTRHQIMVFTENA